MKFPNEKSMNNFVVNFFTTLDQKDLLAGTKPSMWDYTDQPLTVLVEADALWQSEVWKISLYSYYLKLISYKSVEDLQEPENEYAKILTPEIEMKFLNKINTLCEVPFARMDDAHNYSGFVSIIKGLHNKRMTKLLLGDK
jgi:hypothetical protein